MKDVRGSREVPSKSGLHYLEIYVVLPRTNPAPSPGKHFWIRECKDFTKIVMRIDFQ